MSNLLCRATLFDCKRTLLNVEQYFVTCRRDWFARHGLAAFVHVAGHMHLASFERKPAGNISVEFDGHKMLDSVVDSVNVWEFGSSADRINLHSVAAFSLLQCYFRRDVRRL